MSAAIPTKNHAFSVYHPMQERTFYYIREDVS